MEDKMNVPYNQVAKEALMNWNGLSQEEANKVISESSFDEIESQVYATGSMNYAIEEISRQLKLSDEEKQQFIDAVFGKVNDPKTLLNIGRKFAMPIANGNNTISKLVVDIMTAVHDGWVVDNANLFFTKKQERGQQYQYLPIELIGWDEAKSDLLFIKPIIYSMGLASSFNEELIRKELDNRTIRFFDRLSAPLDEGTLGMRVHNLDDLGEWLGAMEYMPWTSEIEKAMEDDTFVKTSLLPQIREKGFVKDVDLISKLESKGLFKVDGPSKDEIIEEIKSQQTGGLKK